VGGVEDLARLEVNIGELAVEPRYLLFRERFEDVHQGKQPYSLFQQEAYPFVLAHWLPSVSLATRSDSINLKLGSETQLKLKVCSSDTRLLDKWA
jgi:hypothetical protein